MYTQTIKRDIFKFDELPSDVQASVIQGNRDWNIQFIDWYDFVFEDVKTIADIIGLDIDDIFFSGFASQGDGASFTGEYNYSVGSLKSVKKYAPKDKVLHDIVKRLVVAQRRAFYKACATVTRGLRSNFYSHSGTMGIDVENHDSTIEINDDSSGEIVHALRLFADWIYARLESEYNYLTSDDQVKDSLLANEREFLLDGTLIY